ncbi:unnamed protein product [Amoebophrya sp. A25]|nr:unnamed protein product [Amoebophrya sp. A25]|eukprot:GSA25T00011071001.1
MMLNITPRNCWKGVTLLAAVLVGWNARVADAAGSDDASSCDNAPSSMETESTQITIRPHIDIDPREVRVSPEEYADFWVKQQYGGSSSFMQYLVLWAEKQTTHENASSTHGDSDGEEEDDRHHRGVGPAAADDLQGPPRHGGSPSSLASSH